MDRVLENTNHKIDDKVVECKQAFPKALLEAEEQQKQDKESLHSSEDDTHHEVENSHSNMYESFHKDAFSTSKTGEVQIS